MSLPKLAIPTFVTKIPSTGQEVEYRPFLVKEEKVLLMALDGRDEKEMARATLNIIDSCVITDIDSSKLATFDVEHLFLQIRGKSVGEIINMKVNHGEDSECKHVTSLQINLEEVTVDKEVSDGKIMLDDNIGVKMRYPSLNEVSTFDTDDIEMEIINNCIEYVYDKDSVYSDFTKEEMIEWLGNLKQSQYEKITEFLDGMPRLSYDLKWKCEACGKDDSVTLEGLSSFFT